MTEQPNVWNARTTVGALLLLAAVWLFMVAPYFRGEVCLPWDARSQFYPNAAFVADSIERGQAPFWNPYLFGGYPFVSDPQNLLFSPLMTLGMLAAPQGMDIQWFDCLTMLHLLLGGAGLLLLLRSMGLGPPAALFGALIFMFAGPATARLQHVPIILAYGYAPWAFLTLKETLDRGGWKRGLAFGLASGLLCLHLVQVAYLFGLVLVLYFLYRATAERFAWCFFRRALPPLALGSLLALCVALPQVVATISYLPFTNRMHIRLQDIYMLHPSTYLTVLAPNFFNSVRDAALFFGRNDITECFLYAGALPIMLLAFIRPRRIGRDARLLFPALLLVLAVLFSIGQTTPFYAFLYHHLPGLTLFRRPQDGAFILVFALAMIEALLLQHLLDDQAPGRPARLCLTRLLPGLAAVAGLATAGYAAFAHRPADPGQDVFLVLALLLASGLGLVQLHDQRLWPRRAALVLLLLVFVADLRLHNIANDMNAHRQVENFQRHARGPVDDLDVVRYCKAVTRQNGPIHGRTLFARADRLGFNTPEAARVETLQGYNPMVHVAFRAVHGYFDDDAQKYIFTPTSPNFDAQTFDLLGLDLIVSADNLLEVDPSLERATGSVYKKFGHVIWRNDNALPRLYTVQNVYLDTDQRAFWDRGRYPDMDFHNATVLERWPEEWPAPAEPGDGLRSIPDSGQAETRCLRYENNRVLVEVSARGDCLLTLSDLHYPAWRATLDGREVPIYKANYLYRAVAVPPGRHDIEFSFHPFAVDFLTERLRSFIGAP